MTTQDIELESEKEVIKVKKNPIKIKKVNPRPSKGCHDQEKLNKSKRTSQRYNPKDSGNYQKQIPLPYGTQKKINRTIKIGHNKTP